MDDIGNFWRVPNATEFAGQELGFWAFCVPGAIPC